MPQDFTFHRACERGDKKTVEKILRKSGKEILKQPGLEYGQSPLHVCCEFGQEELVQFFLQDKYINRIEINSTDKNGWTPLHAACKNGHFGIIELLLKKGAYCRAVTNEGASPLHYFVRSGDKNEPMAHSRVMKLLIDNSLVDSENKHGETPLHQAAMKDRFQNVSYLLNANADPNRKTKHGETPLHFAARGNSHESTTILLQANADPTIETNEGISVYSVARKWETSKIKGILIAWYQNNGKGLTHEMREDTSDTPDAEESSEKRTRKKRKKERSGSNSSLKSPKDKKKREKDINRVSSLREMDSSAPRRSSDTTSAGSAVKAERRRSNSISDLGPDGVDKKSVLQSEEYSSASLSQRIQMMQQRAAARENETKLTRSSEPCVQPSTRVNALVSNFEQLTSPVLDRNGAEHPMSRIQRLKDKASDYVDLSAIEEQVTGHREDENTLMATLRDIGSKKLSLASVNDSKIINFLKDGWECKVCKIKHQDVPLFFFCATPDDYEELDATEKYNRAKISADLCVIETKAKYFVRGLLELPLRKNSGSRVASGPQIVVTWGLWVQVTKAELEKIEANWNNNVALTITGALNNNLPVYNDTKGIPVTLTTRPGGFRPLLTLKGDSMLAKDCTDGIPMERLGALIEFVQHSAK